MHPRGAHVTFPHVSSPPRRFLVVFQHTRTKPRHAWTNGFVERLQGTILQELWRVAFRRRYFTTRAALQRALDGFMRYYNTERPHQGYRLRGRTPAALVWGVATQSAHSPSLRDGGSVNTVPSLDTPRARKAGEVLADTHRTQEGGYSRAR
jgi:Integrase core domain